MTYENIHDLLLREKNGFTIYVVHDSNLFLMWVYICIQIHRKKTGTTDAKQLTVILRWEFFL